MPGPGKKRPKKKGIKKKLAVAPPVELLAPAVISSPPLPIAEEQEEIQLPREPPIYDPGNGPRVKNINAFFASSFCCPPSFDDELCAEFAQEEMLDMLYTVLPHELALVSLRVFYLYSFIYIASNSVYGIIRAGWCLGYALPAGDCTVPVTCPRGLSKESGTFRIGITHRCSPSRSSVDFVSRDTKFLD